MHAEDLSRITNLTVAGTELGLVIPPALLESISRRVLELLAEGGRLPESAPVSEFMNVVEAAAYLRCDRQRIYDLVSARRLPKFKDGSRVLIRRADLVAYLEEAA
jgi:excisionase family DNA binding protein